jgi:hypothetical protein
LMHDYALGPAIVAGREKAIAKARDPIRRAKIAKSKRGTRRPRHVVEAIIEAHRGKKASDVTRRKMSELHRLRWQRGRQTGAYWASWEDRLVMSLSAHDAAKATGRSVHDVRRRARWLVEDGERNGDTLFRG